MAEVKAKKAAAKAPVKKAAAKPKDIVIVDDPVVEDKVVEAPAPPLVPTLNAADAELIADAVTRGVVAAMAAQPQQPAIPDQPQTDYGAKLAQVALADEEYSPGGKQVEPDALKTVPVMPEEAAGWTPEQVAEFNRREAAKLRARKKAQAANRKDLEGLGTAERMRRMAQPRDPSVIRYAVPADWDGNEEDLVMVKCKRRVGLDDAGTMSDLNESVHMPKEHARRLQSQGAVEVAI